MYTWENTGRLFSYQHPPLKNIRSSVLCFAFFTSNQIPFVLCTFLYLQNVLLEKHKHVTMRTLWSVSHTLNAAPWSSHLRFCFLPRGWAWAYRDCLISLFVFHQSRLFLENRPLRMCKLRSCFGGMSPNQGGLKLSEFDKWARELAQLMVPHTELWQARCSWQEAKAVVGSSRSDKMTAKAHTHTHRKKNPLSNSLQAVKSNAEHSSDWQPRH